MNSVSLLVIILLPLAAAAAAAVSPQRWRPLLIPFTALIHSAFVCRVVFWPESYTLEGMIGLDALGRLILLVISLLFLSSSLYAVGYLRSHPTWTTGYSSPVCCCSWAP